MRKGRKSISQTPAPPKDRIKGSKVNPKGSAASKKSASSIELSDSVLATLEKKKKEYNEKHPNSRVSLATLKAVFRRGAGAYSNSHRPTISGGAPNSRSAWAFARVNKFLLKKGGTKVKAAYVQDDDLMAKGGEIKLIAPNGKPSNLTPEQYKLVRTPQFKAWFGDWENDPQNASKVVDENGEPKVMYHGSRGDFNIFSNDNPNKLTWTEGGLGFYFTSYSTSASAYGKRIISAFINSRNIKKSDESEHAFVTINQLEKLKQQDYDSIYFDGQFTKTNGQRGWKDDELVVFKPNQIKLADGTNTTFDPKNEDIRYEDGGQVWNEEDIILFVEKKGNWVYPKNTIYAWLYENGDEASEKLASGEYDLALFPPRIIGMKRGVPPLLQVWTKKYQKDVNGSDKLLGIVHGLYNEDEKKLVIYNMTTRKDVRRKGVNSLLIKTIRDKFNLDKNQVVFDKPTEEGTKFLESGKYEDGGEVGEEITCHNCGWEWNTNDSEKFDKYVCHNCGFDNKEYYMKDGGLINEDNVIFFKEEQGNFMVAKNTIYAWLYENGKEAVDKLQSGEYDFAIFPPTPPISAGFEKGYVPPLLQVWSKKYQKSIKGSNKLIGIVNAWYDEKENKLYIVMMTTRKDYRRKGVNSLLVKTIREALNLDKEQVIFDKPTAEGKEFEKSGKYEVGGMLKKPHTLLEIAKKHKMKVNSLMKPLSDGVKFEMEHTNDKATAKTIALHHLWESPKYYDKLKVMEKSFKDGGNVFADKYPKNE
jgi:hypothetical protein